MGTHQLWPKIWRKCASLTGSHSRLRENEFLTAFFYKLHNSEVQIVQLPPFRPISPELDVASGTETLRLSQPTPEQ